MTSVFVLGGCVCNTPLLIKGCCVHILYIQFVYISLLYVGIRLPRPYILGSFPRIIISMQIAHIQYLRIYTNVVK